ncbi:MAG TPA: penicillin-binding protein 2 [Allosphingosinicella sp.]|nr:penicillin-binding protein 2 [Allosphingosinicella sp.]
MATLAAQIARPSPPAQPQQGLALTYHRLMLVMFLFVGVTFVIVARLTQLQLFTDRAGSALSVNPLLPPRGDIVDRNGLPLARTFDGWTIAVRPGDVIGDKSELARRLAELVPGHSAQQYFAMLNDRRRPFIYIARSAVPETVQAVNALGEPGIVFDREPRRLYPQTVLAGHVLGWVDRDGHGASGMEQALEAQLSDPARRGQPVALSIDSRAQAVLETELATAVSAMQAEGGTGIVMDVQTGEIIAMASAPTFNPNAAGRSDANSLYNRATMGVYEFGSTFKPITVAAAMEARVVTSMQQRWDATAPIAIGRYQISDDHPLNRMINIPELMVHSSNIGTARIADAMGPARMQAAFRALGFDRPPVIELRERTRPLFPSDWGRATVMTSGFGHGLAITPLHLASAYAALVNGGVFRPATLLKVPEGRAIPGRQVYSEATSYRIRQLLRLNVQQGTGRRGEAAGFRVGGKTGTGEKAMAGGYNRQLNVSTFAAAFPMDAPRYVVIVMMDAPRPTEANSFVTTAAFTAAPIVSRVIAAIGPLLNVIPSDSRDIDTAELMPPLAATTPEH